MRRVMQAGPNVTGDYLEGAAGGLVAIGSPAWLEFLTQPGIDTRAFTFPAHDGQGLHKAYREWRAAGPGRTDELPYWYCKVRVGVKIRRFYLGRPADIDGPRLAAVATAIAEARSKLTVLLNNTEPSDR